MRYRAWIKTCEPEISGDFESGGIDSNGNPYANSYALRTKDFIEVDSSKRYFIIIRNGLTLDICLYDSNKNYRTKETYSASATSGNVDKRDRTLMNVDLSNNGAMKYVKMVIHRYNPATQSLLPEESLYATALSVIDLYSAPVLIHDSLNPDKSFHLNEPKLVMSDSCAGSFDFSIEPKHRYYSNKINLMTDTVYIERIYDDGSSKIIWDGRPISESIGWDKIKNVHCEGALAYLNDSRVSYGNGRAILATIHQFITGNILNKHNLIATDNYARQDRTIFYNALSTPASEGASIYVNRFQEYEWWPNFEGSLQWLNDYIIGAFGGHMKLRYNSGEDPSMRHISRKLTIIQKFDYVETISQWVNGNTYSENDLVFRNGIVYVARDRNQYTAGTGTPGLDQSGWYDVQIVTNFPQKNTVKIYSDYATWEPIKWRFSEAKIDFGKNLLNYTKSDSISEFATRIIPRGKSIDDPTNRGLDYHVYLNGVKDAYGNDVEQASEDPYLDDKLLQYKYGIIEACVDFNDAENPTVLLNNAKEWFSDLRKSIIDSVIEVSIVDLGDSLTPSASDDPYCDSKYIDLWTRVYVTAKPFGLQNEEYYVTQISIPLDDPAGTELTLTSKNKLLTDSSITNGMVTGTKKGVIDHNIN